MRASRVMPWIVLLALAAFPLVASQADLGFYVSFVRRVMIFALAAASLNFILGYGGMVALGVISVGLALWLAERRPAGSSSP